MLHPGVLERPKKLDREQEYENLIRKFAPIHARLPVEKQVELDGLLWDLSLQLVQVR
jgi:hypothetical protein